MTTDINTDNQEDSSHNEANWNNASWVRSRRAMIRQTLKLTVRQRLEALEDLCETSAKLKSLKVQHHKTKG